MHKFFATTDQFLGDTIFFTQDDYSHIVKVLRLKKGEEVLVGDTEGREFLCSFEEAKAEKAIFTIKEILKNDAEPSVKVTIFQGVPKSDKMDFIVQKATELGVFKIVPVMMARSVKKPKDEERLGVRWNKIAYESAKQSKRGLIPKVEGIVNFEQAIELSKACAKQFILYENEEKNKIRDYLKNIGENFSIAFFVGPEGGFSEEEISKATDAGIMCLSLGKRILRTETASLCALAAIMYETGNL